MNGIKVIIPKRPDTKEHRIKVIKWEIKCLQAELNRLTSN